MNVVLITTVITAAVTVLVALTGYLSALRTLANISEQAELSSSFGVGSMACRLRVGFYRKKPCYTAKLTAKPTIDSNQQRTKADYEATIQAQNVHL